jgi:hypothetical protein
MVFTPQEGEMEEKERRQRGGREAPRGLHKTGWETEVSLRLLT